jgi:HlyD family secretion protein
MKYLYILLIISVVWLSSCNKQNNPGNNSSAERIVAAKLMDIETVIEEEGEVAPMRSVQVKSGISGRVMRILVNEGDYVKRGEVIARIEADREQARSINTIVNNYETSKIAYEEASREYDQNQELFELGFISKNELINSENKYIRAKLSFDAAKEEYELTKSEMGAVGGTSTKTLAVTSPLDGVVIEKLTEEGELVSGETSTRSGTIIFTIADSESLVVKADINEYDIPRIRHNQYVNIRRAQDRRTSYNGRVFKIAPMAITKDGVKVYPVEVAIENPDYQLRFGMSVALRFRVDIKTNTLAIPVTALFIDSERQEYAVVQKEDGAFEERKVKRGINNEYFVEIIEGLNEGDKVVSQGGMRGMGMEGGRGGVNPLAGGAPPARGPGGR